MSLSGGWCLRVDQGMVLACWVVTGWLGSNWTGDCRYSWRMVGLWTATLTIVGHEWQCHRIKRKGRYYPIPNCVTMSKLKSNLLLLTHFHCHRIKRKGRHYPIPNCVTMSKLKSNLLLLTHFHCLTGQPANTNHQTGSCN